MKIVQALKESSNAISANFDGLEVNHFFHGASSCISDDVKKCKLVKLESVPVCFVWGSAAAGRERCGRRFRRGPSVLRGLRSHKGFHCTLSARWPEPSWSHARYSTPTLLKWQKSSASLKYGGGCSCVTEPAQFIFCSQIHRMVVTLKLHLRLFPSPLQLHPVIVEPPQRHNATLKTVPVAHTHTHTDSCYHQHIYSY